MQPAILLTGATGLIGRYLLRRFLTSDLEIACIVRLGRSLVAANPNRNAAELARQRIEQAVEPFEEYRLLRRPRVIPWDFSDSVDSLSEDDLRWLQDRPVVVVHCAASIRFQEDKTTGEPYRTNVHGVQNLLQLCQQLEILAFHFVSTAYVGDHRGSTVVHEHPVAATPTGDNDYELSKQQAERLIGNSSHLPQVFIHRPSIVIGDSRTGFTSTYHGFYAPLQIGWSYAKLFGFSDEAGSWFRDQLGLRPNDSKNLVPVDWVAESIAEVVKRQIDGNWSDSPASKPTILHWTNSQPVSCDVMQAAIVEAIQNTSGSSNGNQGLPSGIERCEVTPPSPEQFRDQMAVYESYFQSDPCFDTTGSGVITDHLPCPLVDHNLLLQLALWAIRSNFGWPKPELRELPNQQFFRLLLDEDWSPKESPSTIVQLDLLGPGAGQRLWLAEQKGRWYVTGWLRTPEYRWTLALQTLMDCIKGKTGTDRAIAAGYWSLEGNSPERGMAIAHNWINFLRTRSKIG